MGKKGDALKAAQLILALLALLLVACGAEATPTLTPPLPATSARAGLVALPTATEVPVPPTANTAAAPFQNPVLAADFADPAPAEGSDISLTEQSEQCYNRQ